MQFIRSKAYVYFLAGLILIFSVIDFFPRHGRPFFKYQGSDPRHYVWNVGFPISWYIYDEKTPPHWFALLPAVSRGLVWMQGVILLTVVIALGLRRKK